MWKPVIMLLIALLPQVVKASGVMQQDSLNREMVLEKEFVPSAQKVTKTYFTPLEQKGPKKLTPLSFVRSNYDVALNVQPRLFNPLYESHAPNYAPRNWFLKLYGGTPARVGVRIGGHLDATEDSSLDLLITHDTFRGKIGTNKTSVPQHTRITHDTEASLRYTHQLSDGLLLATANLFYDKYNIYGCVLPQTTTPFTPVYPMYTMAGIHADLQKTRTPLEVVSPWSYEGKLSIDFADKSDPSGKTETPLLAPESSQQYNIFAPIHAAQLLLNGKANLGYAVSEVWQAGLGALAQLSVSKAPYAPSAANAPFVIGVSPHVDMAYETLKGRFGAQIQLLNKGNKSVLIVPDVNLQWVMAPTASLTLTLDGGASVYGLRDTYKQNRYFYAPSLYDAMDIVPIRASLGIELGNWYGFSAGVRGGWQQYNRLMDWVTLPLVTQQQEQTVTTAYYSLRPRTALQSLFLNLHANVVTPYGFRLGAEAQLRTYSSLVKEEAPAPVLGLPTYTLKAFATYTPLSRLVLHADMEVLGGMQLQNIQAEVVKLPWCPTLNIGANYRVTKQISASLTAYNIANSKATRWLYYDRPGVGVLGSISFHL